MVVILVFILLSKFFICYFCFLIWKSKQYTASPIAHLPRHRWVTKKHLPLTLGSRELGEVHDTLRVSPLVVVPGNNLHHVISHHHRERGVDGGGLVRAAEVNGDERLVRHNEDAFELGRRGGAEGVVHLLRGRLLLNLNHEVDNGDVRRRHAERNAVELALHLREHLRHSLGRARGGGHDGERGGTRAAHVAVRRVEDALVARVRVRGRHRSLDDSELVVKHLDERREAVGRARRVGDDGELRVVVDGVDTHDVRGDLTLARGGDEHLLGASLDVLLASRLVREDAGGLDDEVNLQVLPRQLERVAVADDGDVLAVDGDGGVVDDLHVRVERSEDGVVLEQVRRLLDTSAVVDRDELESRGLAALEAAHEVASDTSEAVDRDADLHRGVCGAAVGGAERACGGDGASGRQHTEDL